MSKSKYGETAVLAVKFYKEGNTTPMEAWRIATYDMFFDNKPARNKVCPRSAFLGLCEEGLIRGVPKGNYTSSLENKACAVLACKLLETNPKLAKNPKKLWERASGNSKKQHNQQMDVVLALWKNDMIVQTPPALKRNGQLPSLPAAAAIAKTATTVSTGASAH